ncbi:MAG: 5-(carboxyamino)imidazole ribonucleotide mutase [Ignavibacteriota bacterium]|jgi:5-(carboxyamino)imidazole ribonucleotide mutase|nr:MAG: 5-(carboxyamino)imidazole ribonucleotide mutase [Chlorobiota bacterium]MBE7478131.1 5-(carboxyamino)imidazole ribonucleotide mutase [Ignavibacteriales bacterium]MBL1121639.1 5-(carboxyamino)imidazole ribonucleotide mutase [Ignavibacteriota bacterium]MCC7092736.1 5-(carboxyamino)imidazole ribonucleotide mutase [Ignavibacteriaceae bacterium]MCE7856708.1 5-(carboxyamino)imidazole ribonucleotide mutase [Ignavibacteria bacterium CHB3]MEB2296628.1 5-(carboxyamino)imidazole ribonucleotide mut
MSSNKIEVGIIMGSDSDLPVMEDAVKVLKEFEVGYEVKILSAHRTPVQHAEYSKSAVERGLKVIIAAAGGAAHLPGVTAAQTILPVIGVPIKGKSLEGMDSLLSIVQMPPGIPVATVAINGAKNAAILALNILGLVNSDIQKKLANYKKKMEEESLAKNNNINK